MNKFSFLFLAGILLACGSSPKEEKNTPDISSTETETTIETAPEEQKINNQGNVRLDLTNASSPFNFTSNVDLDEDGSSLTFTILDANNNEVQKIQVEQNFLPDSSITVEDMNFDGHLDIKITSFIADNGDINFSCWLYNPNTKKFEQNEQLSYFYNPIFKQKTKQVITGGKGEDLGIHKSETYQYQDGKYLLIESKTTDMNKDGEETITKYKIVDGESMKI